MVRSDGKARARRFDTAATGVISKLKGTSSRAAVDLRQLLDKTTKLAKRQGDISTSLLEEACALCDAKKQPTVKEMNSLGEACRFFLEYGHEDCEEAEEDELAHVDDVDKEDTEDESEDDDDDDLGGFIDDGIDRPPKLRRLEDGNKPEDARAFTGEGRALGGNPPAPEEPKQQSKVQPRALDLIPGEKPEAVMCVTEDGTRHRIACNPAFHKVSGLRAAAAHAVLGENSKAVHLELWTRLPRAQVAHDDDDLTMKDARLNNATIDVKIIMG